MIKVLWFSNTPALGAEFINGNSKIKGTGGWLNALNSEMSERIDLYVAFHYPYRHDGFTYKNTNYYPIYSGNLLLDLIKKRFFTSVTDDEFLNLYLNIIREVQPDIIHIHGTENSFLCLLNKTNIPIVVSIQGNLTVYNHKYYSGFYGKYLYQIKTFSFKNFIIGFEYFKKSKNRLSKMALIEFERMKEIQYVIGRTDWDFRLTRTLSPKSHYFIGDELLRDSFYKSKWSNPYESGKLIIFTTNGDNYYKGLETVFHCISELQKNLVDVEWRIAGVDKDSLVFSICKKFLGGKFPNSGFKLLGSLDEDNLVSNLLESHLYVMPSHIENSPNNLCEAMILGIPSIATFAGGTGSVLKDGEEGILIQDGDPWVMAGAIMDLRSNYNKAILYGENARKRALKRHNHEQVANQYLSVYKNIVNKNN